MSSLDAFFDDEEKEKPPRHCNPFVDNEIRLRIKLAVYAYAYEFETTSLISDAEFDRLCGLVDLDIDTRRPDLDKWFRENFSPHTGQWIHSHPELHLIKKIYEKFYKSSKKNH